VRMEDTPAFLDVPGGSDLRLGYGESVFVGHRWYDARGIAPRFAFGHGLSYARFEWSALRVAKDAVAAGEPIACEIDVVNTSARPGREVVQLYATDADASVRRPIRWLVAFEKIALAPGERRTVRFEIAPRALSFWDVAGKGWKLEPGRFELAAARSSRALVATAAVEVLNPG